MVALDNRILFRLDRGLPGKNGVTAVFRPGAVGAESENLGANRNLDSDTLFRIAPVRSPYRNVSAPHTMVSTEAQCHLVISSPTRTLIKMPFRPLDLQKVERVDDDSDATRSTAAPCLLTFTCSLPFSGPGLGRQLFGFHCSIKSAKPPSPCLPTLC